MVEQVRVHAGYHEDSWVAGEETVLKRYCCARLVADGTAVDVGAGPGEWRGLDLEKTWSVPGIKLGPRTSSDKSFASWNLTSHHRRPV